MSDRRVPVIFTFFVLGACSIACQAMLVREFLTVFSGNELCLGIFFGMWLLWIGIGAAVGSVVARLRRGLLGLFVVGVLVAGVSPLAQVWAVRSVRDFYQLPVGLLLGFKPMFVFTLITLAPFSFLVGLTFPVGCRFVARGEDSEQAASIGWVYVVECAGFLTGGIAFTCLVVHYYNAMQIAAFLLLLSVCAALWMLSVSDRRTVLVTAIGLAVAAVLFWAGLMAAAHHTDLAAGLKGGNWSSLEAKAGELLKALSVAFILPAALALLGAAAPSSPRGMRRLFAAAGVICVVAWACLIPLLNRADAATIHKRWDGLKTRAKLLDYVDSKYEHLAIGEHEGQYEVFASGSPSFQFPDKYVFPQTANYVVNQHPSPKSMLIVGHAAHGLLREFLKAGMERIDHVELDPASLDLIKPYLPKADIAALAHAGVTHHFGDGRYYVKSCQKRYDIVFVNVPDPSTAMLNRYYTEECFKEVSRILNPGGVAAITCSSSANYVGDIMGDFTASIYHTFAKVFKHVVITPGAHAFIFGSNAPGVVTSDGKVMAKRFAKRGVKYETFTGDFFEMLLLVPSRTRNILREMMLRSPGGPKLLPKAEEDDLFAAPEPKPEDYKPAKINTDLRPVSYFFNLLIWDKYTNSKLHRFFRGVEGLKLGWVLAGVAGLVVLRLIYVLGLRRPKDAQIRFNSLLSMFVCGLSAMAFDLLLLFAYQNLFGYLYHMVGLLVALFMFGLALGAALMNLAAKRVTNGVVALILLQAGLVAYAVAVPAALPALSRLIAASSITAQGLFMLLVVVGGMIPGAQFPLVSKLYLERSHNTAKAAGLVDACDHFGACAGALISGAILLPILGMAITCIVVAALNIACIALVAVSKAGRVPAVPNA